MRFSFFTKQTPNEALTLLIDIGSASVGCALARVEKDRAPHILTTLREDITFQESLSSARFLLAMDHALGRALKKIQAKKLGTPAHVFCTLSSPWFILKSRDIKIEQPQAFKITEQLLARVVEQNINQLKEELQGILPSSDMMIIEKKITQTKLNGYEIKNPYGNMTTNMYLSMTVGISSARVIRSIERKIGQFFHTGSIHFSAFPLVAFSALRDIFPLEKSFLFVDITGEATDVSLIEQDTLAGSLSFPRGKNLFIREISTKLRTPHEEASTLFSMFLRNELEEKKRISVEEAIRSAEKEWLLRFEKALATLSINSVLPHKIFFTSDTDIATTYLRLIDNLNLRKTGKENYEARFFDQFITAKFATFESEILHDPFITVEALFTKKIISQK